MSGQPYGVEHKTTSLDISPGSNYWRRLTLDSQVSTYFAGARTLGHELQGMLYDVIRKVQLRPHFATPVEERKYTKPSDKACPECKKKKPAELPHMHETAFGQVQCVDGRVLTDPGGKLYANLREHDESLEEFRLRVREEIGQNPDKYFGRAIIVRMAEEEAEAARDAWAIGRQIREAQLERRWPRNPDGCDSFGSLCSYFDVCTGQANILDPYRYRTAESTHEELAKPSPEEGAGAVGAVEKVRLPVLSSSSAKTFRLCARKYYYAYELRRRPISDGEALRFGTLVHVGLEVWWSTVDVLKAIEAMRARAAGLEVDAVEMVKAEELMIGYHCRWHQEPYSVLAVEQEFNAPLVNPDTGAASKTWRMGGKIDAIARAS
jgi:hypothetical protein